MNEMALLNEKAMTVREMAEIFGCDIHTITNHANRLFPDKIRNGVKTYFNEKEVALILERIKSVKSQNDTLKVDLQGTETALTPALKVARLAELIEQSHREIEAIKDAEIAKLREENAEKTGRLAIAGPKAETLDKITATESDVSVRELAAILAVPHLGQNNLFQKLREDGYIDGFNRPYRRHIESGLMYEKEYYIPQMDATKRQLRITQKGVAHFADKYAPPKPAGAA
jgi:phage antirepressor YoqD-like protein